MDFIIGTYTRSFTSEGIYRVSLEAGVLGDPHLLAAADNPSFVVRHPELNVVYAVIETGDTWPSGGGVVCYRDEGDRLVETGRFESGGADPCHLTVREDGSALYVSNYSSGVLTAIALSPDGALQDQVTRIAHEGSGPNKRQASPHVHSSCVAGDQLLVADLGIDAVVGYPLDESSMPIATAAMRYPMAPGAGPRHLCRDGNTLFVINELDSTVATIDLSDGNVVTPVSTLPAGWQGSNDCAEIAMSPDGRFVYGSNRGHDSIVVFAVAGGTLTQVDVVPSGGAHPRHFLVLPDFVIVANRDSDNLVLFERDDETGRIRQCGALSLPAPVCIVPPAAR